MQSPEVLVNWSLLVVFSTTYVKFMEMLSMNNGWKAENQETILSRILKGLK